MSPKALNICKEEYERKVQAEMDMVDYKAWLNGLYVFKAINSSFTKNASYPSERIGKVKIKNPKDDAENFGAFAAAFNSRRKKMKRGE